MTSPGIADFLLARIAEDEAVAQKAARGPWSYGDVASVAGGSLYDPTVMIASLHYEQPGEVDPRIRRTVLSGEADGTGAHIALHDPARVLAECDAKRRIVEAWSNAERRGSDHFAAGLLVSMRAFALPYTDHPDYREEWRP